VAGRRRAPGSLAFARAPPPALRRRPALRRALRGYAQDQLDWILGRNPFDASLLRGAGHDNPEYRFLGSFEYTNAPGGIVNGITAASTIPGHRLQPAPHATGGDNDWRWGEQWLPHATWYLLARGRGPRRRRPAEPRDHRLRVRAGPRARSRHHRGEKLTHINYAFANIKDGAWWRASRTTTRTSRAHRLRRAAPAPEDPRLRRRLDLVGRLLDAVLTPEEPRDVRGERGRLRAPHDLDGFDVDWEYPGPARLRQREPARGQAELHGADGELRPALDKEGRRAAAAISSPSPPAPPPISSSTPRWTCAGSVDYVNLMTYDFREAEWEPRPAITRTSTRTRTTAAHVRRPRRARVPGRGRARAQARARRAVLRPRLGRVVRRATASISAGKAAGADRDALRRPGRAGHAAGWVRRWDALAQAPFLWNAESASSSATTTRVAARQVRYIREHGLAGAMFWEYSSDPTGALLGALYDGLRGGGATP
jgi:hypothetical protein